MEKTTGLNSLLFLLFVTICLSGCDRLDGNPSSFDGGTRLVLTPESIKPENVTNAILEQTANVISLRLDNYGVKNKEVKIIEDNKIQILLSKVKYIDRVKSILARKGNMELRFVANGADNGSTSKQSEQVASSVPEKSEVLEAKVLLDNSMIKDVEFNISSDTNKPYLKIVFTDIGAKKLFEVTSQGIGRKMAIVLDGQILGSPVIHEAISGGKAMVNLPFSEQEAKDLEIVLNSGAYPVKMDISEVSNIASSK